MSAGARPSRESQRNPAGIAVRQEPLAAFQRADLDLRAEVPIWVPESDSDWRDTLHHASQSNWAVHVFGGGSCLGLGWPPTRVDALIATEQSKGIVEYSPEDFVVTVRGGTSLSSLQRELHGHRQWLAMEPADAEVATIGGMIATAAPSLSAASWGTLRNHLLGTKLMQSTGRITHAGGRVVKNVSGYDLMKLYHGSLGCFGVLLECTLRLRPLAECRMVLTYGQSDVNAALNAAHRVRDELPVDPSTCHVSQRGGGQCHLLVTFEGAATAVRRLKSQLINLLGEADREDQWQDTTDELPSAWQTLQQQWSQKPAEVLQLSLHTRPSFLAAGLSWVQESLSIDAGDILLDTLRGTAYLNYPFEQTANDTWHSELKVLREACPKREMDLVIRRAPAALRRQLSPWQRDPGQEHFLAQLKGLYDPQSILSPGQLGEEQGSHEST